MTGGATEAFEARVTGAERLADGVRGLRLQAVDGRPLPSPEPGSHLHVRLPSGLERDYSLVNEPTSTGELLIAVKLEAGGRGGSAEVFALREGDRLQVVEQVNTFALDAGDSAHVFLAGGIGITPIWSMIQHAEHTGRPWRLHYGARNPGAAPYLVELAALEVAVPGRVHLAFSERGDRLDIGAITASVAPGEGLYCCGPDRIVDGCREAAEALGARAHFEDFSVAEVAEGGYEVGLARSGRTVFVPDGSSILDVVLEEGIDIEYSCMSGTCGTCEVRVVSGVPDHQDYFMTDEEKAAGDRMMICCSGRASGTLVIDL